MALGRHNWTIDHVDKDMKKLSLAAAGRAGEMSLCDVLVVQA